MDFPYPSQIADLAARPPGLRRRGISRAENPIRNYMSFTFWPYMSSFRIGPPAVSAEFFSLAHGMARDWEIISGELAPLMSFLCWPPHNVGFGLIEIAPPNWFTLDISIICIWIGAELAADCVGIKFGAYSTQSDF